MNTTALLADLQALLGDGALLRDPAECLAYGYDNSRRHAQPLAVALPTERAQVQAIVRACRAHRVPLVARGRGTNTTGASVPSEGGVVLSFERMNRLLDIRPGDRAAVVEPGLLNGELQQALRAHGLGWPPDPTSAPYSTVGGNLACNAGGPRALKYGASRDNLLSQEGSVYCSAMVQHCFAAVGMQFANGLAIKNTMPEDIAATTLPHRRYELVRERKGAA